MTAETPRPLSDVEYVQLRKAKGNVCPFCRSDNVDGAGVDIGTDDAAQPCSCLACGGRWVDAYKVTGYVVVAPPHSPTGRRRAA